MNYFREAENILSNRGNLDRALENLKKQQQRLVDSGAPNGIKSIDPSAEYVSGGRVNDTMEDFLDLLRVRRDISITEAKIKEIDDTLAQLEHEEREVLENWYIKQMTGDEICAAMHIGSRTNKLYDMRNRSLRTFAVLYFGGSALDGT